MSSNSSPESWAHPSMTQTPPPPSPALHLCSNCFLSPSFPSPATTALLSPGRHVDGTRHAVALGLAPVTGVRRLLGVGRVGSRALAAQTGGAGFPPGRLPFGVVTTKAALSAGHRVFRVNMRFHLSRVEPGAGAAGSHGTCPSNAVKSCPSDCSPRDWAVCIPPATHERSCRPGGGPPASSACLTWALRGALQGLRPASPARPGR